MGLNAPVLVIAVVGPTATGKSDLGVALARQLGGEVVNADAMQLYRGMDIGTAKLTPAERERVPHHLLDVLDVSEEASVAAYQRAVRVCVDDLVARGSVPVLVGGSGLYVRAALDELQIPPTDRAVRARLERAAEELGAAALHARLAEVDPVAAERILPTNSRRVVRALEVVELTGRPFSATLPEPRYLRPTVQIGLRAARPELDDRIARRVERMWQAGLLDEVSRLVPQGLREGRTASRAVGYAQALAQLDGVLDAEQAQQQTAQLTRRLARRQESWFGRDARITWLDSGAPDVLERALRVVRAAAEGVDGR
ncbi:tRNA dimethylallyltransferase [Angustibacter sp. Root456]|nr:tRNA dimethylallyltransferase [Angustibacter sp. Root456]